MKCHSCSGVDSPDSHDFDRAMQRERERVYKDRAQRHEAVGRGRPCTGEMWWHMGYLGDVFSECDRNAEPVVDQRTTKTNKQTKSAPSKN